MSLDHSTDTCMLKCLINLDWFIIEYMVITVEEGHDHEEGSRHGCVRYALPQLQLLDTSFSHSSFNQFTSLDWLIIEYMVM